MVSTTKYWKTKFQLSDSQRQSIDWAGIGWAYMELSPTMQHWAVKHTSGFFAHGKNMAWWHFWSTMKCPHCTTEIKRQSTYNAMPQQGSYSDLVPKLKRILKSGLERATWPMKLQMPSSGASTNGITCKWETLHQPFLIQETRRC